VLAVFIHATAHVDLHMLVCPRRRRLYCISYRASYISLLTYIAILLLVSMIGLAMHASYAHCDPLVSQTISSGDQVNKYTFSKCRNIHH